jgi:hypothetical protein
VNNQSRNSEIPAAQNILDVDAMPFTLDTGGDRGQIDLLTCDGDVSLVIGQQSENFPQFGTPGFVYFSNAPSYSNC